MVLVVVGKVFSSETSIFDALVPKQSKFFRFSRFLISFFFPLRAGFAYNGESVPTSSITVRFESILIVFHVAPVPLFLQLTGMEEVGTSECLLVIGKKTF